MNSPGLDSAAMELRRSLVEGEPGARLESIETLLALDKILFAPLVVPVLAELVASTDTAVALEAIRNLGLLGPLADKAVSKLGGALGTGNDERTLASLSTLRAIGPAAQEAGPLIFQVVKRGKRKLPIVAAHALKAIFDLLHVDIKAIINYDDYQSFLKHCTASSPLTDILDPDAPKRPKFLADILSAGSQPGGYLVLAKALEESSHAFRSELASRLEPALKDHVQAMPHDTYDEKKTLVKWVNDELRRFDLAIKSPKTGRAASLVVKTGNDPEAGIFQVRGSDDSGKEQTFSTPNLSLLLEQVQFVESPPRRESLAEWHSKSGPKGGGSSRT